MLELSGGCIVTRADSSALLLLRHTFVALGNALADLGQPFQDVLHAQTLRGMRPKCLAFGQLSQINACAAFACPNSCSLVEEQIVQPPTERAGTRSINIVVVALLVVALIILSTLMVHARSNCRLDPAWKATN
jgi:hypothetical protein